MLHKLFPPPRILGLKLHASRPEPESLCHRRRTFLKEPGSGRIALALENFTLGFRRTRAASRHHQRGGHLRISHTEMQRRESAHAEAYDMRLRDREML